MDFDCLIGYALGKCCGLYAARKRQRRADVLVRSSQDVIADTDFQSALFCGAVKSAPADQCLRAADEDVRAPERGLQPASTLATVDAFLSTMQRRNRAAPGLAHPNTSVALAAVNRLTSCFPEPAPVCGGNRQAPGPKIESMSSSLTAEEKSQLAQMIEMFEVIVEARPQDAESLEILKESYFRLGRKNDVLRTSKRIADAHVHLGQLSSAILEYEDILQQSPADPEAQAALLDLTNKAANFTAPGNGATSELTIKPGSVPVQKDAAKPNEIDDGHKAMRSLFVDGKHVSASDFDLCWNGSKGAEPPKQVSEPFIQILADKQIVPLEKSLKLLSERARLSHLPLEKYDVDVELARSFPRETCLRWCILPFDRMSKAVLVATANPFNRQALLELERVNSAGSKVRFLPYIASPTELMKIIRKLFR